MTRKLRQVLCAGVWLCAGVAAFASAGCKKKESAAGGGAGSDKPTIAVIPKGTTHEFWKTVEAGATQAGADQKVNVVWKGPLKEDDRAQQIQIVEQFVSDGVAGIAVAPLDKDALLRPVRGAMGKKIPVVIFDSALNGEAGKDFVGFVATDNRKAGELGGERLAKLLGGKGKVVLLRYQEGSASTNEREAGFLDAIKKSPDIKILIDNRYAGATADSAKTAALNMMDTIKEADGVFAPNESSAVGMLLALRQSGLAGKIKFVGFDATPPLVDALAKGELDALVAQDPYKMGYESVVAMAKKVRGEAVEAKIDTGVHVVDRDNLDTPEMKKLLNR